MGPSWPTQLPELGEGRDKWHRRRTRRISQIRKRIYRKLQVPAEVCSQGECVKNYFGALLFLLAAVALARSQAVPAETVQGPRFEAYAGLSLVAGEVGTNGHPDGWIGAFTIHLNKHVGFDAQGTGSYATLDEFRSNMRLHTLLFGPRLSFPIGAFTPFIHGGFGYSHRSLSGSVESGFAKMGGLGLDVKLPRGFAYRLIEADYLRTPNGRDSGIFSTGLVYRFGTR